MLFIAHLLNELGTMKYYLAAVRHEQISMGLGDLHITQMPTLEYVLKGAKHLAISETRKRLPIYGKLKVWKESVRSRDLKCYGQQYLSIFLVVCNQER